MSTMSNPGGGYETQPESNKRRYEQPILKIYGSVKALTAGGTRNASEANPSGGCDNDPARNSFGCPSDRRIKENIVHVGTHALGVGLYLFQFKSPYRETCGHGRQFGVMADEVERALPNAVSTHPDGYKMVDYNMLNISRVLQ